MKIARWPILFALTLLALVLGAACRLVSLTNAPPLDVTATLPPEVTTLPGEASLIPTPTPAQLPDQCGQTKSYRLQFDPSPPPGGFMFAGDSYRSPDGRWLIRRDRQPATITDTSSGETASMPQEFFFPIYPNQWTPDGSRLALIVGADFYTLGTDGIVNWLDLSAGLEGMALHPLPLESMSNPLIGGWSPDGKFLLMIYHNTLENPPRIKLWSTEQGAYIFSTGEESLPVYILRQAWSPDGRWLAFTWEGTAAGGGIQSYWLTFVSLAGGDSNSVLIFQGGYDTASYDASLHWSPDSQRMALARGDTVTLHQPFSDGPFLALRVPDRWGGAPNQWNVKAGPSAFPWVSWSPDGQSMLIWRQPVVGKFQLDRWALAGDAPEALIIATRPPFFPSADGQQSVAPRMAIYSEGDTYRIDLMNSDGSQSVPFVVGADDAGDPDWSPTGETVAAVWDDQPGGARLIRLSVADAQGRSMRAIETPYIDIRNLRWSPDGKTLAFVGVSEDDSFSVEALDIETGARRVLIDGLAQVIYPRYGDDETFYSLRWRAVDGTQGYSGFNRDGSPAYRVVAPGEVAFASELFFSPDRRFAAVKLRQPQGEELAILPADGGEGVSARHGLSGLGDPVWSPDSALIAFTQSVNRGPISLEIVDTAGRALWSQNDIGLYWFGPLVWEPCQ